MSQSKRQEIRAKHAQQKQQQRLILIVSVTLGALLIAFGLIYPQLKPVGEIVIPEFKERPMANFNTMGDPNAPITIQEFSDVQCSFCIRFGVETEPLLVDAFVKTGKVHFIYRSMGNFIGDNKAQATGVRGTESIDAITAAYCAGDENKFWQYLDILFANFTGVGSEDYNRKRLDAYAEALGLNMDNFKACMDSGKYVAMAEQDAIDGRAAGVTGTPAFLLTYKVNGEPQSKLISGAQPISVFQQEIEAILARADQ